MDAGRGHRAAQRRQGAARPRRPPGHRGLAGRGARPARRRGAPAGARRLGGAPARRAGAARRCCAGSVPTASGFGTLRAVEAPSAEHALRRGGRGRAGVPSSCTAARRGCRPAAAPGRGGGRPLDAGLLARAATTRSSARPSRRAARCSCGVVPVTGPTPTLSDPAGTRQRRAHSCGGGSASRRRPLAAQSS